MSSLLTKIYIRKTIYLISIADNQTNVSIRIIINRILQGVSTMVRSDIICLSIITQY